MRTISVDIFQFNELSDKAKLRARAWYREGGLNYPWWDSSYDDAKQVAALMGIQIDDIGFSGFSSQGDGAHFTGTFGYAKGAVNAVKEHAPIDTELHAIAAEWQRIQASRFYSITGKVTHSGRYQHSNCTSFDIYDHNGEVDGDTEDAVKSCLRSLMDWIYDRLEKENEYLESDEAVDEAIVANEYEFLATGERA